MLLVHFRKAYLSLYLGTPFKEELNDYSFILKVTRIFPYSYTGKVYRKMVNTLLMIKLILHVRDYSFLFVGKKTET